MDSTVHGILQVRIPEWVAFPFYKRSFQCRDRIQVSHVAGTFFTSWATREVSLGCWESHSKTVVLVLLLVAKLYPTLCGPMNYSTPGFPVHHQLWSLKNSRTSSWWCHPTISSSVVPLSSCLQSFPASGSFKMSQFFTSKEGKALPFHSTDCLLNFMYFISMYWKNDMQH